MKVLIVSDGIPEKTSLVGLFALDQATALHVEGNDVVVLAIDTYSLSYKRRMGHYSTFINSVPVEVYNLPVGRRPVYISALIAAKYARYCIKRTIEKYGKFDVLHAHFYYTACMVSYCRDLFKCPLVVTEHSSRINTNLIHPGTKKTAVRAYRNADVVIAVSSALKRKIYEHFMIDCVQIPNVIQTGIFNNDLSEHKKNEGFLFVSVGNLVHIKRMDILISAFKVAFPCCDGTRLEIFGDGKEKAALQMLIDEMCLVGRVTLMGRQSRETIAKTYEEADCFILASDSETFGVAYVEAMAAGLPVIATKCGGPEDFVTCENGLLAEPGNVQVLADAMVQMRTKASDYDHVAIQKNANNTYSPHSIAKMLEGVYTRLGGEQM